MNKAKEFFIREYNNEKMLIHSECVVECCLGMAEDSDLNKDIFIIAGWIHDMGKIVDKENHHEESIPFLHKFLKENPEYNDLKEELEDSILNHRTTGNLKTVYGMILRTADKAASHKLKYIKWKLDKKKL